MCLVQSVYGGGGNWGAEKCQREWRVMSQPHPVSSACHFPSIKPRLA